jgi:hypothetical protein
MLMIRTGSIAEQDAVINKAIADGGYPIASIAGILVVQDKKVAINTLYYLVRSLATVMGEEILLCSGMDERDRKMIGAAFNTPAYIGMYGVTEQECMAELAQYMDNPATRLQ